MFGALFALRGGVGSLKGAARGRNIGGKISADSVELPGLDAPDGVGGAARQLSGAAASQGHRQRHDATRHHGQERRRGHGGGL